MKKKHGVDCARLSNIQCWRFVKNKPLKVIKQKLKYKTISQKKTDFLSEPVSGASVKELYLYN